MEILQIAVCEDRVEEQKNLLAILAESEIPTETVTFASGEDFLREYQFGKYDLLLMDIYMGGMTGVEVVREIRKTDESLVMAFTTTSTDHTLEGYRLNAMKYIEKPAQKKAVLELLGFVQMKKESGPRLQLRIGGKSLSVAFERIVYVEQKNHTLHLYLTCDDFLETTGKLVYIRRENLGKAKKAFEAYLFAAARRVGEDG